MSIHARFTHQAKLHPSRIAVRTKAESMTYAALNTRANQLARYLQSQGLKQGMVVGIFCDRSIEMVVAIYAVSMSLVDILLANSLHELAQSIESKQSQASVFDGFTTESSDFDNVVEESI